MLDINKTCLIVTGTIKPDKNIFSLKLIDKNERLKQYIDSIEFYILNTKIKNIVFCDNSNVYSQEINELIELARKHKKNFEYLYFEGNVEKAKEKGKGYGEGEIINYVFNNSKLIENINTIIKVTGRLKVRNLNLFLKFNRKNINYFNTFVGYRCDTRFYIINKEDYLNFFGDAYEFVNDKENHWLEFEFKDRILKNSFKYKSFKVLPDIDGYSGSTGEKYKESNLEYNIKKIKYYIKKVISKFNLYSFK